MNYRVVFTPEAEEQLAALYRYVAAAASPQIAGRNTEAIVTYCESICNSPQRATMRGDVRPGLRITNYKKRAVIAFDADTGLVSNIGVFYGGQDYETILKDDFEDDQGL